MNLIRFSLRAARGVTSRPFRQPFRPLATVAFALCAFAPVPASAQPLAGASTASSPSSEYTQRVWTVETGLPQGSIYDIAQTPDGYLWLATYGGLVRFDGLRFTVIDAATLPRLASNQISALVPAAEGGLWVAPVGAAIFRTDGRRELQRLPPHPNAPQRVRRMVQATDGALWAACDTGVARFADGRWASYERPDWVRHQLRTLAIDHRGMAWVGTGRGVYRVEGERVLPVPIDAGVDAADVRVIFEDRQRRLWIGGSHGLTAMSGDGARSHVVHGISSRVTTVTQTPDGALVVATADGVFLLTEHSGSPQRRPLVSTEALGGSIVVHLRVTRAGAIVAGTIDNGFRLFTHRMFDLLGLSEGLPGVRVHHVAGDGAGGVWVGSGCDGLSHVAFDPSVKVTPYLPPMLALQNSCVRGLLLDRRGALWIGQGRGALTRVSPDGTTRTWSTSDGLPRSEIGPLLEDRRGRVWAGSSGGVVCRIEVDEHVTCPLVTPTGVAETIWSFAEDEQGRVWIGQVGHLTRVSDDALRTWSAADGLPSAPIRVLKPRARGTVWLGTYGAGLARLRGDSIAAVTTRQGLFDNAVSAMVDGEGDDVWMLGNRGVLVTRWADLESVADGVLKTLEGSTYGPVDGVPEGNSGHPAGANLGQGRIVFATVQGLAVFEPHNLPVPSPVRVLIEDIIGGDRERQDADAVDVPPGGGPVEIRFAAPAVGWPGSVSVRYQLEGRDRGWVDAGDERRAVYSGLAPGTYEFRLAGRRSGGPWSTPITTVTLNVRPFWWQTPVARGAAVVAGLLTIVGLVQWRLRAVERRNRALAREIRERQRAEEDAHRHLLALAHVGRVATAGELTASLAHELGQPLTAIVASAEATRMMLAAPTPDQARIGEILTSISQQGRRASDVMRGLRTFLARGGAELADVDVSELVREVMRLADSSLASARVRLVLDLADHVPPVRGDRVPLQQVVMNLTLNAIDAMRDLSGEDHCVLIRTRHSGLHVRVSVLDNGPGLGRQDVAELFQPFHTTKAGGMGMGLAICRSIVEAHGGRIRGRNRPRGGSVFSFTIPVARVSEAPTP